MIEECPTVSICIPTFNRAAMVGRAIESALGQTYRNIEVLVVDNASDDNIEDVVASYTDPRLKFIKNPVNLGLFGNFNRCVELSRGEFVHILHSDDYIDPEFTEACVRFFEEHPSVSLTFTSAEMHTPSRTHTVRYAETDVIMPAPEGFRRILSERCFITCPSVMIRRSVYDAIGKYSLEYPYSSDYYQWLKVSRQYDIAYVHDATVHYRQGEHSESYRLLFASPLGYLDTLKIYVQLARDLSGELSDYTDGYNAAVTRFARDCLFAGATRTESMEGFSPSVLLGVALSSWGLAVPKSFGSSLKKAGGFLGILGAGVVIHLPFLRRMAARALASRTEMY
ncbi:glycosyltransferase family 2 protein [Methanoculleus taiwanensis]|uniref:glycosyltransferase family 2 protein n=1 Tax=Methanoculleus taiwanensis TaxID=1550565 RepID=UPI000FFF065C|nr:glycosyltransferase [Methanoculleus taiwanensis]